MCYWNGDGGRGALAQPGYRWFQRFLVLELDPIVWANFPLGWKQFDEQISERGVGQPQRGVERNRVAVSLW